MSWADQSPIPNAPGSNRIIAKANNRLGAVISSLYSFWIVRQAIFDSNPQPGGRPRRDAYSVILFNSEPTACIENDFTSSPEELLTTVLEHEAGGGTDFARALKKTHEVMISYWSSERYAQMYRRSSYSLPVTLMPIVEHLLLSSCLMVGVALVMRLFMTCVAMPLVEGSFHFQCYFKTTATDTNARKPLSIHTIAFGRGIMPTVISFAYRWITRFSSLTRMVEIAQEIQQTVPPDLLTVTIPSSFTEALDTVRGSKTRVPPRI
jgi:hypothetical protein